MLRISVKNNSDTTFSIGFHRSISFFSTVKSVANNTITLNGNPGWLDNALQADPHFLLFGSVGRETASEEGKFFPISSHTGSSLTLDLRLRGTAEVDTLEHLQVGDSDGDRVLVVQCWTISSLFAGIAKEGIEILVFREPAAGANNATPLIIYYSDARGQWEAQGVEGAQDGLPIYPGESMIIRNASGQDQSLILFGAVPMQSSQTVVYTAPHNKQQDIHVGICSPLPIRLADARMGEDGDELLVFDNDLVLQDKAASRIFEYVADASPPGWYEGAHYVGASEELLPSIGYILRKAPRGVTAVSSSWKVRPAYLNFPINQ